MDDLNLNYINHPIIQGSFKSLRFWVKIRSMAKIFIMSLTIIIIESQIMITVASITIASITIESIAIVRAIIIIKSDFMDHKKDSEITIIKQLNHFWEAI